MAGYYLRMTDGNTYFANGEVDYTSANIPLSKLADGVTYEVTVVAIPVNGTAEDGQSTTLYFAKAAPQVGTVEAPVISIDPSAEQDGVYYVESDFTISWSANGDVAGYYLRMTDGNTYFANGEVDYTSANIPLSKLADGVTYEVTVIAIPVNGTAEDGQSTTLYFAKAAPQIGTVEAPQISVDPVSYVDGDVQYVNSDATVSWYAGGDVAGYHVTISDGSQNYVDQDTSETAYTLRLDKLMEGALYQVTVTAIPVNGTAADGQSASVRVAREAAPVEEPPVEEPPVEEPVVEQPPVEEPVVEQPPVEEPPAEEPPVTQNPWDMPLTRASDPALIEQMQDILARWNWLTLDGDGAAARGQLDDVTLNAVLAFQTYVNEQYAPESTPLALVDLASGDPQIGTDTLKLIFNTDGISIPKP